MLNLLWHEIRSRRTAIIGWGIGLILFGMMYTLIYPEMEEMMASVADLSIYQMMGVEVATFEGYLGSTIIGIMPILVGVYAVMTSTSSLAGEEDDGTLELLLTTRLKRWEVVVAKGVAIMVVLTVIVFIAALGDFAAFSMIKDQITTSIVGGDVIVVVMSALPLIWAFAMIGLFMGALLPSRRMALMAGLIVVILSYFGENLGGMVKSTEFLKPFSLFTYFDSSSAVFSDGIAFGNVAILLLVAAIGFGLAIFSFQRRDVTVGNWPWQRVRLSQ